MVYLDIYLEASNTNRISMCFLQILLFVASESPINGCLWQDPYSNENDQ